MMKSKSLIDRLKGSATQENSHIVVVSIPRPNGNPPLSSQIAEYKKAVVEHYKKIKKKSASAQVIFITPEYFFQPELSSSQADELREFVAKETKNRCDLSILLQISSIQEINKNDIIDIEKNYEKSLGVVGSLEEKTHNSNQLYYEEYEKVTKIRSTMEETGSETSVSGIKNYVLVASNGNVKIHSKVTPFNEPRNGHDPEKTFYVAAKEDEISPYFTIGSSSKPINCCVEICREHGRGLAKKSFPPQNPLLHFILSAGLNPNEHNEVGAKFIIHADLTGGVWVEDRPMPTRVIKMRPNSDREPLIEFFEVNPIEPDTLKKLDPFVGIRAKLIDFTNEIISSLNDQAAKEALSEALVLFSECKFPMDHDSFMKNIKMTEEISLSLSVEEKESDLPATWKYGIMRMLRNDYAAASRYSEIAFERENIKGGYEFSGRFKKFKKMIRIFDEAEAALREKGLPDRADQIAENTYKIFLSIIDPNCHDYKVTVENYAKELISQQIKSELIHITNAFLVRSESEINQEIFSSFIKIIDMQFKFPMNYDAFFKYAGIIDGLLNANKPDYFSERELSEWRSCVFKMMRASYVDNAVYFPSGSVRLAECNPLLTDEFRRKFNTFSGDIKFLEDIESKLRDKNYPEHLINNVASTIQQIFMCIVDDKISSDECRQKILSLFAEEIAYQNSHSLNSKSAQTSAGKTIADYLRKKYHVQEEKSSLASHFFKKSGENTADLSDRTPGKRFGPD